MSQIKAKGTGRAKGEASNKVDFFAFSGQSGLRLDWQEITPRKAVEDKENPGMTKLEDIEDWKGRVAQALRNAKSNLMKANSDNPSRVEKIKNVDIVTVPEGATIVDGDGNEVDVSGIYLYNETVETAQAESAEALA
jgi:hypothetical protein